MEVVTFMPWLLCPQGDNSTHWTEGWVGPKSSTDMVVKRQNPCPYSEMNPSWPVHSLLIILTELPQHLTI